MKLKLLFKIFIIFSISFFIGVEKIYSQSIDAGYYHTLMLCGDGTVKASGSNGDGQLGDGTYNYRNIPFPVEGLTGIIAISAGGSHSLALKNDGTVWAWGGNWYGQLGDSTYNGRSRPVEVYGLSSIIAISAGQDHSLALKSDGTLWAWGYNSYGQLGDSTYDEKTYPVQVKYISGVVSIGTGNYHSLAVRNDGTVWAWGRNSYGQLGDGSTTGRIFPGLMNDLSGITAVSGGYRHTIALKSDGTVWACGYNSYGQLGDGTSNQRTSPVQTIGITGISSIAAGRYFSLATMNDGSVWAWGDNGNYQLGDGTGSQSEIPLKVATISGSVAVSAGNYYSIVLKNDDSFWGWGYNYDGQLGDGNSGISQIDPVKAKDCCFNDPEIAFTDTCIIADTTEQGGFSRMTFYIKNTACGSFIVSNISSSNAAFTVNPTSLTVPQFDSVGIILTFSPMELGDFSGKITISNNDKDTSISMRGYCVPAPAMSVSPTNFEAVINSCSDAVSNSLTINNTGAGILKYNIDLVPSTVGASLLDDFESGSISSWEASADVSTATLTNSDVGIGGHCLRMDVSQSNNYGAISRTFTNSSPAYISFKIKVPVNSSNQPCVVAIGNSSDIYTDGSIAEVSVDNSEGMSLQMWTPSGSSYLNISEGEWYQIEFRNINYSSKTFDYYVNGELQAEGVLFWNQNIQELNVIHLYAWSNNSTAYFDDIFLFKENPPGNWIEPTAFSGVVAPSDSSVIDLNFLSTNIVSGVFHGNILVSSNDPLAPVINLACRLTVIGAPKIYLPLENSCPKFDTIMVGAFSQKIFMVDNIACDTLYISNVGSSSAEFIVDSYPSKISPYSSGEMAVSFKPTTANDHSTIITVNNNDKDTTFCLQGVAIPAPTLSLGSTSFDFTINSCTDSILTTLSIGNTGTGVLNFSVPNFNSDLVPTCAVTTNYNCCQMGIYNVTLNTINNSSVNGSAGYQNFTSLKTTLLPGNTYTLTVQTGTQYSEYVNAWIDWNSNGTFESQELVMNDYTYIGHTSQFTIPVDAVQSAPLRMRVVSDYYYNPQGCNNVGYGQHEDYTIYVGNWLSGTFTSGTLSPANSTLLNLNFKSAGLTNGKYVSNIIINSNDPLSPKVLVPCTLTVAGTPMISFNTPCLDFGELMVGAVKKDSVLLTNSGCDTLKTSGITASHSVYTFSPNNLQLLPGESKWIVVTYAPTAVTSYNGGLTFQSNINETTLCVKGTGIPAPVISLDPGSINISIANCNDSVNVPLTIYNNGAADLTYTILSTSILPASCSPAGAKENCCGMGIYNVSFNAINNTTVATDGRYNDYSSTQKTVVQPGKTYNISIQTGTTYWEYVKGWIDYNNNGIFENSEQVFSDMKYQIHSGNITIPNTGVLNIPLRMRIASDYQYSNNIPGACTNAQYGQTEDYSIQISDWLNPSTTSGTISPSSYEEINLKIRSTGLNSGVYHHQILFNSNDPVNSQIAVPVSLNVIGVSEIYPSKTSIYMDSIMEYTSHKDSLYIRNTGCDTLSISNITQQTTSFSVTPLTINIIPQDSVKLYINFLPVSTGEFIDTLDILNNAITKRISLKGKAYSRPNESHSPGLFNMTLACADTLIDTLTINNTGSHDLIYSLSSPGQSAHFNGSGFIKRDSPNLPTGSVVTVEAWIYPTSYPDPNYNGIVSWGSRYWNGESMLLSIQSNGRPSMATWGNDFVPSSGPVATLNQWNHIAVVVHGASVTLYMNGQAISGTLNYVPNIQSYNLAIGVTDYPGRYFNGKIDEVQIYNRALSQEEILTTMNKKLIGNETGLKGYWNFDSGNAIDLSPAGNDLTSNSGVVFKLPNAQKEGWINYTPSSGTLAANTSAKIVVKGISTGLSNGTYTSTIVNYSNDPLHSHEEIPVTLNVIGAGKITNSKTSMYLDSIMTYTESEDTFYIKNTGCDTLRIYNISKLTENFSAYPTEINIAPYDSAMIMARFSPITSGIFYDTLYISNNDVLRKVELSGKAFTRPIIDRYPISFNSTVNCGDTMVQTLVIHNNGGSNLTYTNFTGNSEPVATTCSPGVGIKENCCGMGIYKVSLGTINNITPESDGRYNDYSSTIKTVLQSGENYWLTVRTGPSYNEYVRAWIDYNSNGTFENTELVLSDNTYSNHSAFINIPASAVKGTALKMRVASDYYYSGIPGPCTNVYYGQTEDYTVFINNEVVGNWLTLTSTSDIILPNDSAIVTLKYNGKNLDKGTYSNHIQTRSNDPLNIENSLPVSMTIVGVGKIELSETGVYLDSIMSHTTKKDSIFIRNTGCDTLKISNITNLSGIFAVPTRAMNIAPYDSAKIFVSFSPTTSGTFYDTLGIINNDVLKKVYLSGKAFLAPVLSTNPSSINSVISCCDSTILPLKIYNTGGSDLTYTISQLGMGLAGDTSILVIQEANEWGVDMQSFIQSHYGKTAKKINSNQIASTDFSSYDIIIVTGNQSSAYYNYVSANKLKFESFVNDGGIVQYQLGNYTGVTVDIVAGVNVPYGNNENYNTVLLPAHPIVKGLPITLQGGNANSGYFSNLPGNAKIITGTQNTGKATTVEYLYGKGLVIATSMLWGHLYNYGYNSGALLPNSCAYAMSQIESISKWLSISPKADTISSNDSSAVYAKFKGCGLSVGTYTTRILVKSNDPLKSRDTISFTMQVTGTGKIALSRSTLYLDSIMEYTSHSDSIFIRNAGCDTLKVSNISKKTNIFSFTPSAINILPGDSAKILVRFLPTLAGTFYDTLHVFNSDVEKNIYISGKSFARPIISVVQDPINVHLLYCQDSIKIPLNINNTGPGDLAFQISSAAKWIFYSPDSDTLLPGGNSVVNLSFIDTALIPGTYTSSLIINSNDPIHPKLVIPISLVIDAIAPSPPLARDTVICFNNLTPDLTAAGSSINWYADGELSQLSHSGNSFATGKTAVGVYTYYVTQTLEGCQSSVDTVTLTINAAPAKPMAMDISVCFGSVTPALFVTGENINWYNEGELTSLAYSGNSFVTGKTSIGTHTYYLSDSLGACPRGLADTVALIIKPIPSKPMTSDTSVCFGSPTPGFFATGIDIKWYSDGGLNNLAHRGNSFDTSITAAGTYTYYVNQTDPGTACKSSTDTSVLIINAIPSAPVAPNKIVCEGNAIPDLTVTGTNVKWYSDAGLITSVHSGSPFSTGNTAIGTYTYYVTQTSNGCNSTPTVVSLTINAIPARPIALDTSICFGSTVPGLTATGSNIKWYSDGNLSTFVHSGSPYMTLKTDPGTYIYYVTQTISNCKSAADTSVLLIKNTPSGPLATDQSVCYSEPVPDLVATGNNIIWYSDISLNTSVHTGNTFATGNTAAGNYIYYVTQSVDGCTGVAGSVNLSINALPDKPVASDVEACFGSGIPNLNAIGTNINWYSDEALTISAHKGASFNTGHSEMGEYRYYVTDSVGGCSKGVADTVTLTINALPLRPHALDTSICFGSSTPDLTSTGSNIKWYSDGALNTLIYSGSAYSTLQMTPGTYAYYVTQTNAVTGCQSLADTSVLNIIALPSAPVALNKSSCEGTAIADLTASGTNIKWYSDSGLGTSVFSGSPFITGHTSNGTYTYYVTQSFNGCNSNATTVALSINSIPAKPFALDTATCFGSGVPNLTATGSSIKWYSDGTLSTLRHSGSPFVTGKTAAGTYSYYVTQTIGNCQSLADTSVLNIKNLPSSPLASDKSVCFSEPVPDLIATGNTIIWYSDLALNTTVHAGNTFATGNTAAGNYTYYTTQSVDGCRSVANTVSLVINSLPNKPVASDVVACFGSNSSNLNATGTFINWYSDGALTVLAHAGSSFNTGLYEAGQYNFYVTDSVGGCPKGVSDTVILTINGLPSRPHALDTSVCAGNPTPDLTSTGSNIKWYSNGALNTLIYSGSVYPTLQTTPGTYTYFVTQTNASTGCQSLADTSVLHIIAIPSAPVAPSKTSCEGSTIADLTASGTNIQWYGDAGLSTSVYSGSPFTTGHTAIGTYTYYVTQSSNGCISTITTVTLSINPVPAKPIAMDTATCFGSGVPDLKASGSNIDWYSDGNLSTFVHHESPFATGKTAADTITYYVTQTINNCQSLADTSVLIIRNLPSSPLAPDKSVCFSEPVPDLTAIGNNIIWYNDIALTNSANTGNTFVTSNTAVGNYIYYVTQSADGCTSVASTVSLSINSLPGKPVASDIVACYGSNIPNLNAMGTHINWYNDAALTVLTHSGASFNTSLHETGEYSFYVTDSVGGCPKGISDTVHLTINALPSRPAVLDAAICFGSTTPELMSPGSNVKWYSDVALNTLLHSGNAYSSTETATGTYTYYITQTDGATNCQSPADTAIIIIHPIPAAPLGISQSGCKGGFISDLRATGTDLKWYRDAGLSILINSGNSFHTGQTETGTHTYYVTQSVNSCTSEASPVSLVINPAPAKPNVNDTAICFGSVVPDLSTIGTNIKWYRDGALNILAHSGNALSIGQTIIGNYAFYVTDSLPGCPKSIADTVVLSIKSAASKPKVNDVSACFGDIVPDFKATGSNIKWYSDSSLTKQIHSGNIFNSGLTDHNKYTFYATDSLSGCPESPASKVTLTIISVPAPISANVYGCFGSPTPSLNAEGEGIKWYNDASLLIPPVHTGNSFTPKHSKVGVYTYYVTASKSGCHESPIDTVMLTINPKPLINVNVDSISIIQGGQVSLEAYNGVEYNWSPSSGLNTSSGPIVVASPTSSTIYTVRGTNAWACSSTASITVMVSPTSIWEREFIQTMKIYPNPASDEFTIIFNSNYNGRITVKLLNLLGQAIITEQFEKNSSELKTILNIEDLAKGIYDIQIISEYGQLNTKLVTY